MPKTKKIQKEYVVRARCSKELRAKLDRFLDRTELRESDVVRLALIQYLKEFDANADLGAKRFAK